MDDSVDSATQSLHGPPVNKRSRAPFSPDTSVNSKLVINELLCYLHRKYGIIKIKILKQIILDFYDGKQITARLKTYLWNTLINLNPVNWTRLPKRRKDSLESPGSKANIEIEDIVTMTVFIDVNALGGQMPHFVAADPDKLPSQSLSTGDLQCVLNKFHTLTDQIQSIQDAVTESSLSLSSKMVTVLNKVSNNRLSNSVPGTQSTSQY